jgi:hypothetical protein
MTTDELTKLLNGGGWLAIGDAARREIKGKSK